MNAPLSSTFQPLCTKYLHKIAQPPQDPLAFIKLRLVAIRQAGIAGPLVAVSRQGALRKSTGINLNFHFSNTEI
jgi:hypothetical protein